MSTPIVAGSVQCIRFCESPGLGPDLWHLWVVSVGRTSQHHFGLLLGIGRKNLDTGGSVEASWGKTERERSTC